MCKRLPANCFIACTFLFGFAGSALAQNGRLKAPPTDAELMALVNKYVQTPVTKTTRSDGAVFLQRNLTPYLQATVLAVPDVPAVQKDHGHNHKDEMLRSFLNRPHPSVATLNNYFSQAAAEFNVPVSLLKATAQVQSNWAQVSESIYGSWGVMGLIENQHTQQISAAASLLQVNTDAIKNDAKTNIRAAAALLASYQNNTVTAQPEDWFEAVRSLTGLWDEALKTSLAVRIYDVVNAGSKTVSLWGEIISIDPVDAALSKAEREPGIPVTITTQRTAAVDYPNAVANFTTCNYNSRPAGSDIKFYFMHYVATGTYQGAINWFKDCSSSVSAHYVIRNNDGEVSQVVAEADRAWSQGVTLYNDLGIGVEHEVLATNLSMWDSDPMLTASANLCVNVCNRQAIPKTRRVTNGDAGIYGHSDVRATDCPNLTPARWTAFLTRLNTVNVAAPILYTVINPGTGTQLTASWKANIEPTLAGYRLYYATNDAMTTWALAANESTLTPTTTFISLDASQFIVPPGGDVYHFKLTAVAADGTNPLVESAASDVYSRSSNSSGPKVLLVDGFDRWGGSGSYPNPTHPFAASYFKSLRHNAALQISSAANEKVEDGTISLAPYNLVVWFVGDESSANVVFSTAEKNAIKAYLDAGGKMIVSGSEIAYNIGRSGSAAYDLAFMNNYLKAAYVGDGSSTYTPAASRDTLGFTGFKIPFGFTYHEDFPDAISPVTGTNASGAILNYSVLPNRAAIAYKGKFGAGTVDGGMIFLSFPLETATDTSMTAFMNKALAYFAFPVVTSPVAFDDAAATETRLAKRINVLANDFTNGGSFSPSTLTIIANPANGSVTTDNNGNVTYVSNAGFTGTDSYQYTVQNSNSQVSNTARVIITVAAPVSCNPSAPEVDDATPKRDLRGAWVSTVSNIDWPSSRTLTTAQQQAELIRILDTFSVTGINTVFLQIRPECDALYASTIDPWSYWLTNAQGTAPNPFWDPLAFAIDAAHARGMELHAWLNPYRARQSTPALAASHVAVLHPDWTFASGTLTMLNPGLPEVRTYITQVIADIATRYDVDGIHFDDYFYPSAGMTGQDNATYTANNPTNIATIEDWRRSNVNGLIARVYDTLNLINTTGNRNIIFGVSPAGIWKSGTPVGITGNSSYSALYCDPVAWLQAGKVDYVAPQLYWKVGGPQDYTTLSRWWNDQGLAANRYIYPGLALYRLADASDWGAVEIESQVAVNRDGNHEQVRGQVLFSTKQLMLNSKGIKSSLQNGQFNYKAIPPAMLWKDAVCPNAPTNVRVDGDTLRWDTPAPAIDGDLPRRYTVYYFASAAEAITNRGDGKKLYAVVYNNKLGLPATLAATGYFAVNALDKNNNESEPPPVILPVTGLQFVVKLSGSTALLNWTTQTEVNTLQFEIERSMNGNRFDRINTVTAAGNANNPRAYNSQELLLKEGSYYYRIKTIDRDGRSSYSPVRLVVYRTNENGFVIGPNPFQAGLTISQLSGMSRLELVDLTGRILVTKQLNNQSAATIDGAALPAGVYHLKLVRNNGTFSVVKVVKL